MQKYKKRQKSIKRKKIKKSVDKQKKLAYNKNRSTKKGTKKIGRAHV